MEFLQKGMPQAFSYLGGGVLGFIFEKNILMPWLTEK
jgi:hypothetical protein